MTEEREEIIKEWITALRSGEYRQTTDVLRRLSGDNYCYCCLGVLCDLAERRGIGRWDSDRFVTEGLPTRLHPPHLVRRLIGLNGNTGQFTFKSLPARLRRDLKTVKEKAVNDLVWNGHVTLAHLNDAGVSFATIADVIEARPEGLFMGDE